MKTAVVPAQVTTVEDRIIGNLSFVQVLLLVAPVFFAGGVFALLPPLLELSLYKYIVMIAVFLVSSMLAIRMKGVLVVSWIGTMTRYNLRTKYYVADKNTPSHRCHFAPMPRETKEAVNKPDPERRVTPSSLAPQHAAHVYAHIENPSAGIHFETTKRGGVYVRLAKIKDES